MNKTGKINLSSMEEEAKKSDRHETFQVLNVTKNCRMGIGTTLDSSGNYKFFIEVLVSLCKGLHSVDITSIESHLGLLKQLKERGYTLNCEEAGCITSELTLKKDQIASECKAVHNIMRLIIAKEVIAP